MSAVLYLLPVPIASEPRLELPAATIGRIASLERFVVENEKSAWRVLSRIKDKDSLSRVTMELLDEHTRDEELPGLLKPLADGFDLGLLSEAGCPCVADPGARLVHAAHEAGITVTPMVGPSSLLLALMASGLEGQRFAFHGYLPVQAREREQAIRALERSARDQRSTQLFIETPYRNAAMLASLLSALQADTMLATATGLQSAGEEVRSMPVRAWRSAGITLGKVPTVFLIGTP